MTFLEKLKVNLNYLLGNADSSLYAGNYKSSNLTLKDWQKRWEIFSDNGNGFVWYGVDEIGNIGEFASDQTYVPEIFFQDASTNKKMLQYFADLPEITSSVIPNNLRHELKQIAEKQKDEKSFWKTGANKGLFLFDEPEILDFKDSNGKSPYELILTPETPLNVSALPNEIQNFLEPYHFKDLKFADCKFLDVSKYFYCKE